MTAPIKNLSSKSAKYLVYIFPVTHGGQVGVKWGPKGGRAIFESISLRAEGNSRILSNENLRLMREFNIYFVSWGLSHMLCHQHPKRKDVFPQGESGVLGT